ncbi:hypothetical protein DO97_08890 [Neosynechococcus sphagnicola sy1]|uniref:Uncharacterized protein n=1 Tax=Neosynechococcus sphagnicola sy1 TaxID=1497020 RepID=A0A098TKU4_9CYAN|nr:hypothetical protein [Neosynechococcus sphagnicola]KGF72467.1 hypothetical protein DO97_08890 [Neosynechococcus sphagnicola sy1]
MNSNDLAQYLEATDSVFKPWLLMRFCLQNLKQHPSSFPPEDDPLEMADIHPDLMNLWEGWQGVEDEVF